MSPNEKLRYMDNELNLDPYPWIESKNI
jgi:hypothetical protein